MKSQPGSSTKMKTEEDSSSEEEKQWVTTKEKLLKRMGKKDQARYCKQNLYLIPNYIETLWWCDKLRNFSRGV